MGIIQDQNPTPCEQSARESYNDTTRLLQIVGINIHNHKTNQLIIIQIICKIHQSPMDMIVRSD